MSQDKHIEWEPLPDRSFNPEFSGYTAAPYFTDHPELGFCLYSRDGRGSWNQRTKRILPPEGWKAHPVFVNGQWWWSYEAPNPKPTALPALLFDDLDYFTPGPPMPERGEKSETDVTHAYDGIELCTNPCGSNDEVRIRVDKTTHQIRIPKESETETETLILIEPRRRKKSE